MLEAIAYRGPDGLHTWIQDSVGLGHAMLWTTPESLQEQLPWTDPQSACVITADARIDNREELIQQVGWRDRPALEISDSQLILESYLRWGKDCPTRLLGDFAFIIWDPRDHGILAVRDPLGVKPLYYHYSDQLLALGSEIVALLSLQQISRRLNDARIAGYLVQRKGILRSIFDEYSPTLYQDVYSLPPGHLLWVTPEQNQRQQYWQLDIARETHLESNAAYGEAFRDLFIEAVRCRLRSAFPTGVIVSGGLDSSSVACVARDLLQSSSSEPLHTFSAIFPNLSREEQRLLDERPFLELLNSQPGFVPHLFAGDRLNPLREQGQILYHPDEWIEGNNLYLLRHSYHLATQQGVRVVLDGIDGDIVVSHGLSHLKELAQAGRWLDLIQHRQVAHLYQGLPWGLVWDYLWAYQIRPTCVRGPLRQLWPRFQRQDYPVILNADLAERVQIQERLRQLAAYRAQYPGVKGEHYLNLSSGIIPAVLTSQDRLAGKLGIEPRHPFFDRRLVEFCLSLPTSQKLEQGWSRIILRRAMDQILPPAIQWRKDKANLIPCFNRNFMGFEHKYIENIIEAQAELLDPYVDLGAVRATFGRCLTFMKRNQFTNNRMAADSSILWIITLLTQWLGRL